jgi:hypothetical protein
MRGRPIPGLKRYQGRNPNGYFQDLPWEAQRRARSLLWRWCQKWGRNLPQWRRAILIGQAKRLALNPPTSEWGRSMLAKRGGRAVQRKYRREGRHPTEKATWARIADLKIRKEAKRREALGLPPASRHGFTLSSRYEL